MTPSEQAKAYQLNAEIKKEINSHKVNIDGECFQKSPEEKRALKTAKHFFKLNKEK